MFSRVIAVNEMFRLVRFDALMIRKINGILHNFNCMHRKKIFKHAHCPLHHRKQIVARDATTMVFFLLHFLVAQEQNVLLLVSI